MPAFGKRSRERLRGVDMRLRNVLNEVVKHYDITILEGLRSKERQEELVAKGASKTMKSKHLEGMAVDIAPYPLPGWNDRDEFVYMAGRVMQQADVLKVALRWGGDWNRNERLKDNRFDDLVHFEVWDK